MIVIAKNKLKKLLPIFVIIVAVVLIVVFVRNKSNGLKVSVETPQVRTLSKTISASGQTGVSDGYTVRALLAGSVSKVNFKSGDEVKEGDIVLEFDRASLNAGMSSAYSAYLGAKADQESYDQSIAAAKATEDVRKRERDAAWRAYMADNDEDIKQRYKNAEALYQTALASLKSLEDGKKAVENSVGSGYASYVSAYQNYANGVIKAPTDGKLALGNVFQGSFVTAGQELFAVTRPTNLVFKAEIDEADVSHIKVGMQAKVGLDSYPGDYFTGTIESIDAKVIVLQNGSTAVMADVSFDTSKVAPIIGLGGSVDIEIEKSQEVLSVSPDSIFDESDAKYVWVVRDGVVHKNRVEQGFEGDEYVGITGGLSEEDLVVIDPAGYSLQDNMKVTL